MGERSGLLQLAGSTERRVATALLRPSAAPARSLASFPQPTHLFIGPHYHAPIIDTLICPLPWDEPHRRSRPPPKVSPPVDQPDALGRCRL
jgi:hypothetical protein